MELRAEDPALKLDAEAMTRYWNELSHRHLRVDDEGLAAICYAGMPPWFNRFLDVYQRKAMARIFSGETLKDARILDIGTGVGRWPRWFVSRGAQDVVGIDMEPARLEQARAFGGPIAYHQMSVDKIAFEDAAFDIVSSVTVLQHVDDATKREAIREIARLLKPGGKAIVFEETHLGDDAAHVFPWSKEAWTAEFARHGLEVTRTVGDQYTPLLRALKTAFTMWKGKASRNKIESLKNQADARALMLPLRIAVSASYPIEEIVRFLPSRFAKITGFLFVKAP